jgi:hypothetical protein
MTREPNPFHIADKDVNAGYAWLKPRAADTIATEQKKSASSVPEGVPQYVLDHGESESEVLQAYLSALY